MLMVLMTGRYDGRGASIVAAYSLYTHTVNQRRLLSDEEIVVATTRIETMLGDTAVAVHPSDERCVGTCVRDHVTVMEPRARDCIEQ